MSQRFDLNLDELEQARPAARAVALIFGGLLIGLSAVTTAAFFEIYAGDLYALWFPELSPYLAALTGILVFEGAALSWQYLRAHAANTRGQLTVAAVGSWAAMAGGIMVTVSYFSLSNRLLAGQLDQASLDTISLIGGALIVAGVAMHFVLIFVWQQTAMSQSAAQSEAGIRALRIAALEQVQAATTRATLQRTLAEIGAALPEASTRQGSANADHYIASTFDRGQGNGNGSFRVVDLADNARPTPSPNERG
jgi:hypothetical protein